MNLVEWRSGGFGNVEEFEEKNLVLLFFVKLRLALVEFVTLLRKDERLVWICSWIELLLRVEERLFAFAPINCER